MTGWDRPQLETWTSTDAPGGFACDTPTAMQVPVCFICGDVIGVYEPLVVVGASCGETTSLAREPQMADRGHIAHRDCSPGYVPEIRGTRVH